MLLKKQTVWLLTMLSLVVVLSVYYVTTDPNVSNLAAGEKEKSSETGSAISEDELKIITEASGDEVYEAMRLEIQDERSKTKDNLTSQVGSPDLTAAEKNELYEEMDRLAELEIKEKTVESNLKGLGYEDALVKVENNQVSVNVKISSDEHTRAEAVKIVDMVREEVGTNYVPIVNFDKE